MEGVVEFTIELIEDRWVFNQPVKEFDVVRHLLFPDVNMVYHPVEIGKQTGTPEFELLAHLAEIQTRGFPISGTEIVCVL